MPSRDRVIFIISFGALAWFYGFATSAQQWFPNDILVEAWRQGQAAMSRSEPPVYLHARVHDRQGVRSESPAEVQPGLTFVTSAWVDSAGLTPGLKLIDEQGAVLHEWRVDPSDLFRGLDSPYLAEKDLDIQGSYLLPNGDVLANVEYVGTLRLDACGAVQWRLHARNHHSISRSQDGTFWIPATTPEPRRASPQHPEGFPGIPQPVYQDLLMHVAADGTVLDTINVLDVIYANGLQTILAVLGRQYSSDPTHLNDIEALPDSLADEYPLFKAGDLLVSLRGPNLVFVLDPETERVLWHATGPFVRQHDPDFIGDGWIGVFDNQWAGTNLTGSRIVALQPHTDSVEVLYPTDLSEPFFTDHRGKWQMLANRNLLLTEEQAGRVAEVAPDGRTVWEWIVEPVQIRPARGWPPPDLPAEESSVPAVTKATRVDLTRQEVAAWPCSPA